MSQAEQKRAYREFQVVYVRLVVRVDPHADERGQLLVLVDQPCATTRVHLHLRVLAVVRDVEILPRPDTVEGPLVRVLVHVMCRIKRRAALQFLPPDHTIVASVQIVDALIERADRQRIDAAYLVAAFVLIHVVETRDRRIRVGETSGPRARLDGGVVHDSGKQRGDRGWPRRWIRRRCSGSCR